MVRGETMKITLRIWILLAFILFSVIAIFSIPPLFLDHGVLVKTLESNSTLFNAGLRAGATITGINGQPIKSLEDYNSILSGLPSNLSKVTVDTKSLQIIGLFYKTDFNNISVENLPQSKIKTGLDIQGGARALVAAQNHSLTDNELEDLISISQERLNLYGLSDVNIRKASDLSGSKYMVVEIAGSSPSDLENLIAQQGKFEAKIGNETVFSGGSRDITYVGRSGQDAGIYDCFQNQDGQACTFRFTIYLSETAAEKQANVTSTLGLNITSGGQYLDKKLDLYLDGKLLDSLNIGADLKGKVATQIQISGSGTGADRNAAITDAQNNMKKLQTVLITGSLPFKLEIVKIDRISPLLGQEFTRAILVAGAFAILAVSVIIFLRYRKIKLSLALLLTSFSELIIILGVAALIKWNLDLPSIAGIIATIGTGVDSQIVILDESRFREESVAQRIKKALFIIFTAFATAAVSLLPLTGALGFLGIGAAGAGLLKGFAVTTLIGITAGVFITRPAFADIIKQNEE
jgi:preprotein translocase subunit SecD